MTDIPELVKQYESRVGLREGMIFEHGGTHIVSHHRQVVMMVIRQYLGLSHSGMARAFNRTHRTTLRHAENAVRKRMDAGDLDTARCVSIAREICEAA